MRFPQFPSLTSLLTGAEKVATTVAKAVESAPTTLVEDVRRDVGELKSAIDDVFESRQAQIEHAQHPDKPLYSNANTTVAAADPGVIRVGSDYYLVHTGSGFPMLHSKDLVHWQPAGSIFPKGQPAWAKGDFWAPEIHHVGNQYVAYFTARDASGKLRIGAATAKHVTGPYTDIGHPFVGEKDMGLIDPTFFADPKSGKSYLIYKRDGNAVGQPTDLMIQELSADGLSKKGEPQSLIRNTLGWEGPLVEAPEMTYRNGYYYLFYSANTYGNGHYAVGVARARSPLGPFEKHARPILSSSDAWRGPGHGSIVTDPQGKTWFSYHAWRKGHVGPGNGNSRQLLLDRIEWKGGWPMIGDGHPSNGPRLGPGGR